MDESSLWDDASSGRASDVLSSFMSVFSFSSSVLDEESASSICCDEDDDEEVSSSGFGSGSLEASLDLSELF